MSKIYLLSFFILSSINLFAEEGSISAGSGPLVQNFDSSEELSETDIIKQLPNSKEKGELLAKLIKKNVAKSAELVTKFESSLTNLDKMRIAYAGRYFYNVDLANKLSQWLQNSSDPFILEYCIIGLQAQNKEVALKALEGFKKKENKDSYIKKALDKALTTLKPAPESTSTLQLQE